MFSYFLCQKEKSGETFSLTRRELVWWFELWVEQQHFHKSSFFTGIDNGQNVTCAFAHFSIMNKMSLSLQEKQHRVTGN